MNLKSPSELPTEHTIEYLERVLPSGPLRVLEVGCGDGAVADRLRTRGVAIIGIDCSPEAVVAARERGVRVVEGDFLEYRDAPFDVLLFTRSLHHMAPLPAAIEHARELLVPGGLLVAEEFAIEQVDRETARWYFELNDLLETMGLLPVSGDPEVAVSNQLERWYEEYAEHQPIHAGEDMTIRIGARFELLSREPAPYLYRLITRRIEASDRGVRVARWVFDVESLRVADGSLRGAGLRLTARKNGGNSGSTAGLTTPTPAAAH